MERNNQHAIAAGKKLVETVLKNTGGFFSPQAIRVKKWVLGIMVFLGILGTIADLIWAPSSSGVFFSSTLFFGFLLISVFWHEKMMQIVLYARSLEKRLLQDR